MENGGRFRGPAVTRREDGVAVAEMHKVDEDGALRGGGGVSEVAVVRVDIDGLGIFGVLGSGIISGTVRPWIMHIIQWG